MPRIGKDTLVGHIASRVEQKHLLILKGGQGGHQIRALKKCADILLDG